MRIAKMQESGQSRTVIDVFGGYNHNDRIKYGEFFDMKNLSSDHYPLMQPRSPRRIELTHRRAHMCGMKTMGNDLWFVDYGSSAKLNRWNGTELTTFDIGLMDTRDYRKIVPFGAYLLILPDYVYINTADPTEFGEINAYFTVDINDRLSFSVCDAEGTELSISVSNTAPPSPKDGQMWMKNLDPYHTEYYKYSASNATWLPFTAYLKITASAQGEEAWYSVSDVFAQDDAIHMRLKNDLSMFSNDASYQIVKNGSGFIVIPTDGIKLESNSLTFDQPQMRFWRTMPKLDFLFEHDNRLWGCCWYVDAKTHRIVNEIHASKLGDFKNWNSFQGISTDSYVISCGSDGKWTGAAEVGGYPCFFKEKYLHKVYGSMPATYSCDPVEITGVQEGCDKSLSVANGVLYYKAIDGIYKYDGSLPVCISSQLGNVEYHSAVGGSFGNKYYISMLDSSDNRTLFVYDIQKRMWHKEDDLRVEQFCCDSGTLYCLLNGGGITEGSHIYSIAGGSGTLAEQPSQMEWYAETGIFGEEHYGHKYYPRITLRMKIAPCAAVKVFADYDSSGRWTQVASIIGKDLRSFNFPLRTKRCDHMRLRIEGKGEATIYSITFTTEKGSAER